MAYPSRIIGWPKFIHPGWFKMLEAGAFVPYPKRLFYTGADGVVLNPSEHSTLWIDEAKTQQATLPGDPVWWIDDLSGNDNHFAAVNSAARGRLVRWPASAVLENS